MVTPLTKDEAIKIFCNPETGKLMSGRTSETYLKKHGLYERLICLYSDCNSIREILHRLLNGISEKPVCKVCGKPVQFYVNHYPIFCSKKCVNSDPEVLAKNKAGVSKSLKKAYEERHDEIIAKRAKSLGNNTGSPFSNPEYQAKGKETIMERYGVDNVIILY